MSLIGHSHVALYFSNGVEPIHWWAKGSGATMELGPGLQAMMPHREDMAVLTEGRGIGSGALMLREYDNLVELTIRLWNHHFEFLNLGYAAYLDFFGSGAETVAAGFARTLYGAAMLLPRAFCIQST